jgi:pimeloyl-ACP methyl ester carboxylesterase
MTAEIERRRFGTTLPVHWWDQPTVGPNAEQPFEVLINAAVTEVIRLSTERGDQIDLLANSFGAYVTRALVDRVPERIGAISICGGVWDLSTAILRLGFRFAERNGDEDLNGACRRAAQVDTPEGYVALLARIAAIPGFLDCYWGPSALEPRETMRSLAAEGRLIDWHTCQSVMTAALVTPQIPLRSPHPGKVRVLLGRHDPYFDQSDVDGWKTLWPGVAVEVVETGHFPHLELPPSVWMPGE